MIVRLVQTFYSIEDGRLVVHLRGRREDGKAFRATVHDIEPSFYVTEEPKEHPLVKRIERGVSVTLDGRLAHRIVTKYPKNVPEIRQQYAETFEADVLFEQVVKYRLGIKSYIEVPEEREILTSVDIRPANGKFAHRVLECDIETFDKHGFASPRDPTAPVLSIAFNDSFTGRDVVFLNGALKKNERDRLGAEFVRRGWNVSVYELPSEAAMFANVAKFLRTCGPSFVRGWNFVLYDWDYLRNRSQKLVRDGFLSHSEEPDWREHVPFDNLAAYARRKEGEAEGLGLDFVARQEGIGHKEKTGKVWEMYERRRDDLVLYNVVDVHLSKGIADKLNLLDFFVGIADFCGIGVDLLWMERDGYLEMAESRLLDAYILHALRGRPVLPTKVYRPAAKYQGAVVVQPTPGLYRNVIEADITGAYANAMRTLNLSPETRVGSDFDGPCFVLPSGNRYRKDRRGILPMILDELIRLRYEFKAQGKKEEERVAKEIVLTAYGQTKQAGRLSDPLVAADITWIAREQLRWNQEQIRKRGGVILAGDTDACFYVLPDVQTYEENDRRGRQIVDEINASYMEFLRPMGVEGSHYLEIKHEHVYDSAFFTQVKKRYVALARDPRGDIEKDGVRYTMKVRGFELRRSNAAAITKRTQQELFRRVLFGAKRSEVAEYVRGILADARNGRIPIQDFYLPVGLGKGTYKSVPEHVRAARWSNRNLEKNFVAGDKVRLLFGRVEGKETTDAVALEWDDEPPEGMVINWDKVIDRTVLSPLSHVFELVGLRSGEVLDKTHDMEDIL